jgi:hypothetical protein
MEAIRDIDELIEVMGGTTAAAAKAGVTPPAVSNWRTRGFIPPEFFVIFSDEARLRGREVDIGLFKFAAAEARA